MVTGRPGLFEDGKVKAGVGTLPTLRGYRALIVYWNMMGQSLLTRFPPGFLKRLFVDKQVLQRIVNGPRVELHDRTFPGNALGARAGYGAIV